MGVEMKTVSLKLNEKTMKQIDDIVLRQVQARLDQEEVRLSRSSPVD
jgi:hypothetical protein